MKRILSLLVFSCSLFVSSKAQVAKIVHPAIGTTAYSSDSTFSIKLIGKKQYYAPTETATADKDINSPKSVNMHPNATKYYVNSLEGATICDKDYSMMDFCVLMHIFFKKINFLKKEARQPFSKFVEIQVLAKSGFSRNYNNYASDDTYIDFEKQLDVKQFNFKSHPIPPEKKPSDYRQLIFLEMSMAFQEIGRVFQKSPYFIKLKELRKTVNEFVLQ